jgi:hypothetical protein
MLTVLPQKIPRVPSILKQWRVERTGDPQKRNPVTTRKPKHRPFFESEQRIADGAHTSDPLDELIPKPSDGQLEEEGAD